MTIRLEEKHGMTADDLRREAILLAIREHDDVAYTYNYSERKITPDEARSLLPELLAGTISGLGHFRDALNRRMVKSPLSDMGNEAAGELDIIRADFNGQMSRLEKRLGKVADAIRLAMDG